MTRLDVFMVNKGLVKSRERAKYLVQKGLVVVNGKIATRTSLLVADDAEVNIQTGGANMFVSRGGLKLQKAITDFRLSFSGCTVLDVGASTGGFTHCALQNGVTHVWAIDVGTNQLVPELLADSRVTSIENCDIRTLPQETIPQPVNFIVADLSFISLTYIAEYLPKFLVDDGSMVLLVKPQFEAGREFVNKNGIVKDSKAHIAVLRRVTDCFQSYGFNLNALSNAPIYDKRKNIEYITLYSRKKLTMPNVEDVVLTSFQLYKDL